MKTKQPTGAWQNQSSGHQIYRPSIISIDVNFLSTRTRKSNILAKKSPLTPKGISHRGNHRDHRISATRPIPPPKSLPWRIRAFSNKYSMWAKRASGVSWPQTFHRLKPIQGYVRWGPVQVFFLDVRARGKNFPQALHTALHTDDNRSFMIFLTPFFHHRIRKIFLGAHLLEQIFPYPKLRSKSSSPPLLYCKFLAKRGAVAPGDENSKYVDIWNLVFFLLFFSDSFTLQYLMCLFKLHLRDGIWAIIKHIEASVFSCRIFLVLADQERATLQESPTLPTQLRSTQNSG